MVRKHKTASKKSMVEQFSVTSSLSSLFYVRMLWMAIIAFHNPDTTQQVFLNDKYATKRWVVDIFYLSFSCDFKVYLPDKPGKYNILFRFLEDSDHRHISRVIPYTTPAINAPPRASNIQEVLMEMWSDLFHTGRMATADRL